MPSETIDSVPDIFTGIFLVISNLALIPAIDFALVRGQVSEMSIFIALLVTSSIYHLCQAGFLCLFTMSSLQMCDHFFVYGTILWMTLYFFDISFLYRFSVLILAQVLLLPSIISYSTTEGNDWYIILALVIFLVVFAFYAMVLYLDGLPRIDWKDFLVAVILIAIGLVLFVFAGEPGSPHYAILHSFWHIFVMVGIYFILELKDDQSWFCKMLNKMKRSSM